jgi:hypothetical protein
MSGESAPSRAGQIARQILLFGRPIPNEELLDRLDKLTVERLRDLANRLFTDVPSDGLGHRPGRPLMDIDSIRAELTSGAGSGDYMHRVPACDSPSAKPHCRHRPTRCRT